LKHLDALQLQVGPLLQRRQHLQTELQRLQTRLQTRLEELTTAATRLRTQQSQRPPLEASAQQLGQTLSYLEQRRAYQEQVREKGLERRSFVETLQTTQRACERQMAEVAQKLKLLEQPRAVCPLCDRPLDPQHRTLVQDRHRLQYQDLQDQLWGMREQLAVTEREIQVLRQEYRAVEAELEGYGRVLHQQGRLEAQIAAQNAEQQQLQHLEAECRQLQECLRDRQYATDLQGELDQIEATLGELAYDDRDHALARGQVNRLRWADLKRHELTQARRRQRQLLDQAEKLEASLADLEQQWTELEQSPLKAELDQVESQLLALNYPLDHHQQVRLALQEAQGWLRQQQILDQARQQQPLLNQRLVTLQAKAQDQKQVLTQLTEQIALLEAQLPTPAPSADQIAQLEAQITALQLRRDSQLAQLGALTQTCRQLESLQQQRQQKQEELAGLGQHLRVCQELAQAFGRKGIQAMMIENLLPQLEAETNHILGRLSGHQMHVRFATQRPSKGRQPKSIETLDILIADAQGTRPYETYSGGEAFRVNFAIRLALARLLAQRSGTALQLLIIDEGFGTQDQEGCDRLIAAINAIATDFSCILVITHIPHFRAAFQTRLDVAKTDRGSQVELAG
ncbi:MAG TPA: SMC family ATPase, partial [Leptolyngbyaceae cyanobacterium M65_K2018_010]|nr:SMC family ATPase [Leptolyngbyaceae cyanobacterium M65_K2018_010]